MGGYRAQSPSLSGLESDVKKCGPGVKTTGSRHGAGRAQGAGGGGGGGGLKGGGAFGS